MKKQTSTADGRRLELKKTSIAKLNLTKAEMQLVAGGGITDDTENTSKALGYDDETNCTGRPTRPTIGLFTIFNRL